jgi:hypothetical protein
MNSIEKSINYLVSPISIEVNHSTETMIILFLQVDINQREGIKARITN